MSRSNGGEGREANPKVCASIIGAPQTVTHFSLVHFFAESQRERAESQREHAECQRAEKERERAEKEKAQLLPRGARDAGRNHHRLLLVWRVAAEVGRPALSARVAAIMTAAS